MTWTKTLKKLLKYLKYKFPFPFIRNQIHGADQFDPKEANHPASPTAFYNSSCWWYCQLINNCVDPS